MTVNWPHRSQISISFLPKKNHIFLGTATFSQSLILFVRHSLFVSYSFGWAHKWEENDIPLKCYHFFLLQFFLVTIFVAARHFHRYANTVVFDIQRPLTKSCSWYACIILCAVISISISHCIFGIWYTDLWNLSIKESSIILLLLWIYIFVQHTIDTPVSSNMPCIFLKKEKKFQREEIFNIQQNMYQHFNWNDVFLSN